MSALTPTLAIRRMSPMVAMPNDDRQEDDGRDHHLDGPNEHIAQRFELLREHRLIISEQRADHHGDENLEI